MQKVYSQTQFIFDHCCWEQDSINFLYDSNKEIAKHFKIILPQYLNTHPNNYIDYLFKARIKYTPGDFIIHFYGTKNKEKFMREWYLKTDNKQ